MAKYLIYVVPFGAVFALMTLEKRQRIYFVVSVILGGILSFLGARLAGLFIYNARPFAVSDIKPLIDHAANNGFPSDHTLLAATFAFATFFYNRKIGSVMIILALLIGAGRVLVHVHHPIDIFGSFIIAAVTSTASYLLMRNVFNRAQRKNNDKEQTPGTQGDNINV